MAIGNNLKLLLKSKNIKVTTLASLTNIPAQTLYAIIRRDSINVDLGILRKICTATGVNISYFYPKHTNVQSPSNSNNVAEHIAFSAIDLPSNEPNEKHYDITTNNVVLILLENMAEEQGCSPTNIIENILTEHLKKYALENEMVIVNDENDTSHKNENNMEETNTRNTDLPYWMF